MLGGRHYTLTFLNTDHTPLPSMEQRPGMHSSPTLDINTADPGNAIVWDVLRAHVAVALRAASTESFGWQALLREFQFRIEHCPRSAGSRSETWKAYGKPRMHGVVETLIGHVEIDDLIYADQESVQARLANGQLIFELMAKAVERHCFVRMTVEVQVAWNPQNQVVGVEQVLARALQIKQQHDGVGC
ncbi:hypothetical protein C8F04DRAFT_1399374 [Mycena alexandri]|uniref:Uncharacterized protein n=1 Tax=Mycena alexandri TaxID=1745969 RepID=A0AAD6SIN4_9AGAR|nr:hypothetical protein C8F04DRAFT_1399374 [Mycena alexandri]